MAHTLLEQEHTFSSVENSASEINDIFAQQFGYTQNGDYYFSPVDTNFGVRWYIVGNYIKCAVTFDGGATETILVSIQKSITLPKINYHVSAAEKVIYLRIYYNSYSGSSYSRSVEIVIAHDNTNKTVCFRGEALENSTSSGTKKVYMLDAKKTLYSLDYIYMNYSKLNASYSNAIYRYPSLSSCSIMSELFGVINVQAFSISDTYINFGGQVYRIVGCFDNRNIVSDSNYDFRSPYFAFPVSD